MSARGPRPPVATNGQSLLQGIAPPDPDKHPYDPDYEDEDPDDAWVPDDDDHDAEDET